MSDQVVRFRAVFDDQVSSKLAKVRDEFDRLGGPGASATMFGKLGADAIEKGFHLIAEGAGEVVHFVGDMIGEAIKGEASIQKLGTALKANVPNWDGNTAAIEDLIKSHLRLGFADDEQRDSLAKLVAATHNVNEAFNVQRVAMDLARFKGISLADATDALTKVEGGSFRILKSLGIQLGANATQADALAAVEKVASGQAEAFAETTGGKLAAAQARMNDAMERAGEHLLPLVATGLDIVSGALDIVDGALNNVAPQQEAVNEGFANIAKALASQVTPENYKAALSFDRIGEGMGKLATDEGILRGRVFQGSAVMSRAVAEFAATALRTERDLATNYFQALITEDQLATNAAEVNAAKRVLASTTASAAQKADARATLHQLQADEFQMLQDLASNGYGTSKTFTTHMDGLLAKLKKAHGAEKKAIQAEIDALNRLVAKAAIAKAAVLFPGNQLANNSGRASGGPVYAGQSYTVGEDGPETLIMGTSGAGYVVPNGGSATGGGPSTGSGVQLMGVTQAEILEMVERGLYFRLRRAAPTAVTG